VSTKELFIDRLNAILDRETLIIHDADTLDEMRNFIKIIRSNGGVQSMRMAAKKGHHDDTVMALAIYAGSLNQRELERGKRTGYTIL
jgi:hypothetical protein